MPHNKKVRDLMIHLTDYPHIPNWFTIRQAIAIFKKAAIDRESKLEPSTLLVFDENHQLVGSLTMEGLLKGIEKKFFYFNETVEDWDNSFFLESFCDAECKEEALKGVTEIMSPVHDTIEARDSIFKAIFVMIKKDLGLLPVREEGQIIGVIRINEIFNQIAELVLCEEGDSPCQE
jgi:Mg/Co/Ni transporter MgtE